MENEKLISTLSFRKDSKSNISFQFRLAYGKKHSRILDFYAVLIFFGLSIASLGTLTPDSAIAQVRFRDDFEGTLSGWKLVGGGRCTGDEN